MSTVDSGSVKESKPLAITPSYIKYPVFPYSSPSTGAASGTSQIQSSTSSHHQPPVTVPTDPNGKKRIRNVLFKLQVWHGTCIYISDENYAAMYACKLSKKSRFLAF